MARYRRKIGEIARRQVKLYYRTAIQNAILYRIQSHAAISIQWTWRFFISRQRQRQIASRVIQTWMRCWMEKKARIFERNAFKHFAQKRIQRKIVRYLEVRRDKRAAARKIQRCCRNYAIRREQKKRTQASVYALQIRWRTKRRIKRQARIRKEQRRREKSAAKIIQKAFRSRNQAIEAEVVPETVEIETNVQDMAMQSFLEGLQNLPEIPELQMPSPVIAPSVSIVACTEEVVDIQAILRIQCLVRMYLAKQRVVRILDAHQLEIQQTKRRIQTMLAQLVDVWTKKRKVQAAAVIRRAIQKRAYQLRRHQRSVAAICVQRYARRHLAEAYVELLRLRTVQQLQTRPCGFIRSIARVRHHSSRPNFVSKSDQLLRTGLIQQCRPIPPGSGWIAPLKLWSWSATEMKWCRKKLF